MRLRKHISIAMLSLLVWSICLSEGKAQSNEDLEIFYTAMERLGESGDASTAGLLAAAGCIFLGTPYAAHTLELPDSLGREQLVINLRELDCTTLAENCLALARTYLSGEGTPEGFFRELEAIRYRNGEMNGYPSRLHYFCEWIIDNVDKGVVIEPDLKGGSSLIKMISFMSTHPDAYDALKMDSGFVEQIAVREKKLSEQTFRYYPVETAASWVPGLRKGDIVGITTEMKGLHISHVGLIVLVEGQPRLLHASSTAGKVVISEESLVEYLLGNKGTSGIMLARPL